AFEYNLVKWNGSDWVRAFPNGLATNAYNVINKMLVYQNELFLLTSNNRTLVYDGQSWDSTRFDYTVGGSTFTSNFTDAVLFNGAFYGCGSFLSVVGGNYVFSNFGKWDGTQLSTLPSPYETINRVGTDGTYLYAIAKDSTGEVYLGRFDGSNWVNYAHLQSPGLGVIPGYELYDYNRIVSYNGELYIGGRFNQIDGNSIQSFAKLSGAPTNLTPLAPTNLQIAVFKTETDYVQLTWTDNSNNETGFIIQRSVANSSSYSNLDTVAANVTTFDDYAIASFTDYYYKVIAFNTSGNSVASNEVTVSIGSVGLTENALEPSVFPNPTTGLLQVKLQSSPKELNLKDLQGRVLAHFHAPSSSLNLDLTSFENGLYLLECVWESNRVSNVRISKQN
ncbi:MAG: T9SS type A sorting domain-containing protein, partial [Bacteroidia bacterium]|nr:T9SS type A sorting domain-containing protein [Bacteroidia bacterium]